MLTVLPRLLANGQYLRHKVNAGQKSASGKSASHDAGDCSPATAIQKSRHPISQPSVERLIGIECRAADAQLEMTPPLPKEHRLYFCGSFVLHVGEHVSVGVQCKRRAGVPQLLRYHLGRHAGCQCECGCRVPQIIESDPRFLKALTWFSKLRRAIR